MIEFITGIMGSIINLVPKIFNFIKNLFITHSKKYKLEHNKIINQMITCCKSQDIANIYRIDQDSHWTHNTHLPRIILPENSKEEKFIIKEFYDNYYIKKLQNESDDCQDRYAIQRNFYKKYKDRINEK